MINYDPNAARASAQRAKAEASAARVQAYRALVRVRPTMTQRVMLWLTKLLS